MSESLSPNVEERVGSMRSVLRRLPFLFAIVIAVLLVAARTRRPEQQASAFTFNRIRDDLYHAVGTGSMAVGSNAAVLINEADVLLVDSHVSPAAAKTLMDELKAITTKPVRYVVNTHFHFDHAHGNQIYGPNVEIIGHAFTRQMLTTGASMRGVGYDRFIASLPATIARLKSQLDTTKAADARAALERRIRMQEQYKTATDAVRPVPPTIVFDQAMTLYRGGREIRLHFFGRGHTGGDVVVHLPAERALITGDLLLPILPFLADGYFTEWVQTLEQLKKLEFDVVLPGHGAAFRDRDRISHLQSYLTDFWTEASALQRAGVSAEDAARQIDLRNHASAYPSITAAGVDVDAVRRAYQLMADQR